jgi:hypothetical protein
MICDKYRGKNTGPQCVKVGIFTAEEINVSTAQMNFMQEKPLYRLPRNWSMNACNLTFDTFRSAHPLFTKKSVPV